MKGLIGLVGALIVCTSLSAQIPNSGFELWDSTVGYKVPLNWDNMNPVTHASGVHTCERMDFGHSGAYYLGLNTETVPGMGIVPGIAVSGLLDPVTHLPASGFPFTLRPQLLTGAWQYMAYTPSDQGYISVLLSKWNTGTSRRDTIGLIDYQLPGMVMAWTDFYLPFTYYSTAAPDSAMIVLSSSGPSPVAYSFLWVDDLRFADSATLGQARLERSKESLALYPNPANSKTVIVFNSLAEKEIGLDVIDVTGAKVFTEKRQVTFGRIEIPLNVSNMHRGVYTVRIIYDAGTLLQRLVVE